MVYSLFEQRNNNPVSLSGHNEDQTDFSITLKNSERNALKYQEHQSILNNNNRTIQAMESLLIIESYQ
jgi:hypothetical protein